MDDPAVAMFGWLIFAIGAGIITIALLSKRRSRSRTRRVADVLSGLFFCLIAFTLTFASFTNSVRLAFAIAAVVAGLSSWFLGRHVKRMDRALRA